MSLRNAEETVQHSYTALDEKIEAFGVKGFSPLFLFGGFDIIKGFIPDYMHAVCLGVVRYFFHLWTSSETLGKSCHIRQQELVEIDSFLSNVKVPSDVRRKPRSTADSGHWKASEWRNFLLFYSPFILLDLFDRKFYRHWMLLSSGMNILFSKSVSREKLSLARFIISKFVLDIEDLYGRVHYTYNVHILNHLVESCFYWGLPWSGSAFTYESLNGQLLKLFYGTQSVPLQMCKYFCALQDLRKKSPYVFQGESCPAEKLFNKAIGKDYLSNLSERFIGGIGLGIPVERELTVEETIAVRESYAIELKGKHRTFQRVVINSSVYSTAEYCKSFDRDNSYIHFGNSFGVIHSLVALPNTCSCLMECDCVTLIVFSRNMFVSNCSFSFVEHDSKTTILDFIKECTLLETLQAVKASNIDGKCFCVSRGEEKFIMKLCLFESD